LNIYNNCIADAGWGSAIKIYNYNNMNGSWTGTVYCSGGTSKSVNCSTNECESNACPKGTTGMWLKIESIQGNGGSANTNC
jgi:hypothetical protein